MMRRARFAFAPGVIEAHRRKSAWRRALAAARAWLGRRCP